MKLYAPSICWHNRDPVLSCDIQQIDEFSLRLITSGADCHLIVWKLTYGDDNKLDIEPLADLNYHQKAVNTVRFSPQPGIFASADDEGVILLWKLKNSNEQEKKIRKGLENDFENIENWTRFKTFYNNQDILDICWSHDGRYLLTGSIDNYAIVWDCLKLTKVTCLSGHHGYVQGVAWDPLNNYLCTLCSDRSMRVFNSQSKKLCNRISKARLKVDNELKMSRLFYDDTLRTYSRRLAFSPGGEILLAPSGIVESREETEGGAFKFINAVHLFMRNSLDK